MHYRSHNLNIESGRARPVVTVFCAVWHKQPNKLELLRSHWENLKAQTIPVEPCYIFDNDDQPPEWLEAPWYSFERPLSIYEAWSAGVGLARTRYVMNLNMDDRLATDAVRAMVATAQVTKSALVGGEWKVVFDTSHLEQSFQMEDMWGTVFSSEWPMMVQPNLRLGSGSGERGTFGPATLWDLELLGPWYPTYFNNGAPIKSIGDTIFWEVLMKNKQKLTRLPMIVGRYYSDMQNQAEFRPHQDNEFLRDYGVSPVSLAHCIATGDFSRLPGASRPVEEMNKIEKASADLAARYRSMGLGASLAGPGKG